MKRNIARFLIATLVLVSLCFGATAREGDFIGRWQCVAFTYEGETYNAADFNYEVFCEFLENGLAIVTINGEAETVTWRLNGGMYELIDSDGETSTFIQNGDRIEMIDDDMLLSFSREPGTAQGNQAEGAESVPGGTAAREAGFIGKWHLITYSDGVTVYNAADTQYEAIYEFFEDDTVTLTVNGVSGTTTWSLENGSPVVIGNDGPYVFKQNGDNIELTNNGMLMSFSRESGAAQGNQTEPKQEIPYSESYWGSPLGSSKLLEGKCLVINVFMDTEGYPWSEADIQAVLGLYRQTKGFIENQALRYGKELDLVCDFEANPLLFYHTVTSIDFRLPDSGSLSLLAQYRAAIPLLSALNDMIEKNIPYPILADQYETDRIIYCFHIKQRDDIHYTIPYNADVYGDIAYHEKIIYFNAGEVHAQMIPHEILHAFSALDLYYTNSINGVTAEFVDYAKKHYINDIMGIWGETAMQGIAAYEISPLTAYFLGWLDDIPELAMFPEIRRYTPGVLYDHSR